ncbi:MAG: type II toxin-antitoxin system RelE/ParE family toxin [Candidatus Binataceae bacterium]
MTNSGPVRPLLWAPRTLESIRNFPKEVRTALGRALYLAQTGGKHPSAKPLKGFGSAGVLEIVEDFDRNAYRAVYTVRFKDAVYVLHVFQKKSKRGIETPLADIGLIKERLNWAEQCHTQKKNG